MVGWKIVFWENKSSSYWAYITSCVPCWFALLAGCMVGWCAEADSSHVAGGWKGVGVHNACYTCIR